MSCSTTNVGRRKRIEWENIDPRSVLQLVDNLPNGYQIQARPQSPTWVLLGGQFHGDGDTRLGAQADKVVQRQLVNLVTRDLGDAGLDHAKALGGFHL